MRTIRRIAVLALTSIFLVACGGGGGGSDSGGGGPSSVTVSGRATYERVPFSSNVTLGLSYANTSAQPIREAVVELIQSGGSTLATTTTDDNGNYSLTAPANTSVFVRVQAQSRRTTTPARNIRVLNNTNGNALYVLDSAVFNSGTTNQTKNLLAGSGWGGTSYTGTRGAAPFAILDTLLSAARFVVDNGNATLDLPGLDVFWSPQNNSSVGRRDAGPDRIHSVYDRIDRGPAAGIYVLGDENVDTDEYDQHVLAHEFQHFLEDSDQSQRDAWRAAFAEMSGSTCGLPSARASPTRFRRWC